MTHLHAGASLPSYADVWPHWWPPTVPGPSFRAPGGHHGRSVAARDHVRVKEERDDRDGPVGGQSSDDDFDDNDNDENYSSDEERRPEPQVRIAVIFLDLKITQRS